MYLAVKKQPLASLALIIRKTTKHKLANYCESPVRHVWPLKGPQVKLNSLSSSVTHEPHPFVRQGLSKHISNEVSSDGFCSSRLFF